MKKKRTTFLIDSYEPGALPYDIEAYDMREALDKIRVSLYVTDLRGLILSGMDISDHTTTNLKFVRSDLYGSTMNSHTLYAAHLSSLANLRNVRLIE